MSIENYLAKYGLVITEGYIGLGQNNGPQEKELINIMNSFGNKKINIMEIGFNAGHSSDIFLKYNRDSNVTSFDLGEHNYIQKAKEYIDSKYPNRHLLIIGDSRISVPTFTKFNKDVKFDIIFIDGGHDYEIAKADFDNCLKLAHKDTIVILDDTMFEQINGPGFVWLDALRNNKVIELGKVNINGGDPNIGVSTTWGKYLL